MGSIMKKGTAILVSAVMAATLLPVNVLANERVEADNTTGDVHKDFGDISIDEYDPAVYAHGSEGATASATTGDLSNPNARGYGAYSYTEDNGKSDITVNGNVSTGYVAVQASSSNGGQSSVTVNGNVSGGTWTGVQVSASDDGSKSTVKVTGNVESSGVRSTALDVNSVSGGVAKVTVEGNVSSKCVGTDIGLFEDGNASVAVGGDVTGERSGVRYYTEEGASSDVVIEGTLSGGQIAVEIGHGSKGEMGSLTVWKVEPNSAGAIVAHEEIGDNGESVFTKQDKEAEAAIKYIIKVEQPKEGATLTATGAGGAALATVQGVSNTWQVASQGDTVLLKVDLKSGYSTKGAYGDAGKSLALLKDASGNYYIEVPRGGGVYLSVELSKDSSSSSSDTSYTSANTNDNSYTWTSTAVTTEAQAISLIASTPSGGTVTLSGMTGTGLSASVVQSLLARRDITVALTYTLNGVVYKIVIPAGADLTALLNAAGGIDFITLAAAFGAAPVQ